MKAREVIAVSINRTSQINDIFAESMSDDVLRSLDQAGFVILPKEPSEGMIMAGRRAYDDHGADDYFGPTIRSLLPEAYRAMISHAEGEKG